MKSYLPLLFLVTSLCCKKNNEGPLALMPLKIGNEWVYEASSYSEDGTVRSKVETVWKITNKIVLDGLDYYQVNETVSFAAASPYQVNVHVSGGSYPFFKQVTVKEDYRVIGQICDRVLAMSTAYPEKVYYEGYECLRNVDSEQDCNGLVVEKTIYFKPGVGMIGFVKKSRSYETGNMYISSSNRLKLYTLK